MVKDAEAHAEEDKKRKEEIDIRNNADALIHSSEKTIEQAKEAGIEVSEDQKKSIKDASEELKKSLEGTNIEDIKDKISKLESAIYPVSESIYKKAAEAAQKQQKNESETKENENKSDDIKDAEYKEEEKKE